MESGPRLEAKRNRPEGWTSISAAENAEDGATPSGSVDSVCATVAVEPERWKDVSVSAISLRTKSSRPSAEKAKWRGPEPGASTAFSAAGVARVPWDASKR